ncbi:hypothetical protein PVAP13_2NG022300 [Panicum virgatum]|uniref:Uncharacterized protein n=1 Tax=Panicum virgatum TaxID=38727 RepID=A0A8T0VEA5_PANVG|nr:hypothetical protein PVAP13_2NG022300 [Panicum virgatum]
MDVAEGDQEESNHDEDGNEKLLCSDHDSHSLREPEFVIHAVDEHRRATARARTPPPVLLLDSCRSDTRRHQLRGHGGQNRAPSPLYDVPPGRPLRFDADLWERDDLLRGEPQHGSRSQFHLADDCALHSGSAPRAAVVAALPPS